MLFFGPSPRLKNPSRKVTPSSSAAIPRVTLSLKPAGYKMFKKETTWKEPQLELNNSSSNKYKQPKWGITTSQ